MTASFTDLPSGFVLDAPAAPPVVAVPEGFTLDAPQAPAAPPLPEGFTLDAPQAAQAPPLPQGFVLDAPGQQTSAPRQSPGILARAADMFTGNLRTEFPDAPEFGAALSDAARRENRSTPAALSVLGSLVTPDEKAQLDILRKGMPGLEERRDAHGNLMLRLPSAGVSEWTYLNKPGLSARDVGEFVVPTVATLPLGPLYGAGRTIAARVGTGAAAGAAGSVAQDAIATAAGSEQGVDTDRAALGAAFGGALGPLLGRPAAQPAPSPRQTMLEAAERQGVTVPQAMASDSSPLHMVAGSSRHLPFASSLQGAADDVVGGLETAAARVSSEFGGGPAGQAFNAGDDARNAMVNWIRGGSQRVDNRLYSAAETAIGNTARTRLPETRVEAMALAQEMAESGGRANRQALELINEALGMPQGMAFRGLQSLRTEIGHMISGTIQPEPGTSIPALRRLYAAMTIDRNNLAANAGGPRGFAALQKAERVHEMIAQRRADLARIIGENAEVAPERVFDRIAAMAQSSARGDIERLMQARKTVGSQGWNEIASSVVGRLGRGTDDQFSPAKFLTAYGKISDSGKVALFNSTGRSDLRRALDDIATVSRRYEDVMSRYANTSGTGRAIVSAAGIGGMVTMPLQTLATAIGGYSVSWLLSRPVSARATANWANAYLMAAERPSQAVFAVLQQASQKLTNALSEAGNERRHAAG